MIFTDRVSTYPNKYLLTAEDGSASYVILERADDPIATGTPLNAETFNAAFSEKISAEESPRFPGCYYRTVNDEQEWLNPPMVEGVEYRTTERRMGNPVYTRLYDCGRVDVVESHVEHNLDNATLFRQEAACGGYVLPTRNDATIVFVDDRTIEWECSDNELSGSTLYVQLWYTKN